MAIAVVLTVCAAACSPSESAESTSATAQIPSPSTAAEQPPTADPPATTSTVAVDDPPEAPMPADLVIWGGPILTQDPDLGTVEAVAVNGDTITAVGDREEIALYVSDETTVVDLEGRALLPGFVDAHTHLLSDSGSSVLDQQATALANGITSLADASVEPELVEAFLAVQDELIVRVDMYLGRTDNCGEDAGTWYEDFPAGATYGDRLRIAGIKIFADGGTCGPVAASQPFIEGVEIGPPFHEPETLNEMVRVAHEAGYQVLLHAQGDLAIRDAQEAIAAVLGGGPNELRHRIDHNAIVTPELLSRYSEIGIIPVVFGAFTTCFDAPWTEFWHDTGEDWRALIDANPGLPIAWHGDDPSVPPILPLGDLASYVTRAEIDEDGTVCEPPPWLAATAITVEEGLAMMTRNAAYALGRDDEVGSITPGKLADLVVVSADPTAVAPVALFDLEVLATFVGGHVEYCGIGAGRICLAGSAEAGFSVSASSSREDHPPELALDGVASGELFWSSGADAPGWLQVDFPEPHLVERLRFVVFQNPPSDTVHELEVLTTEGWTLVERFEGFTTTDDLLEWESGETGLISAFRITTLESLSWPEWFEIEIEPAP
jgi:predicted amidohydrolase YtcJ